MQPVAAQDTARRYQSVDSEKAHGVTYTPEVLARFVAQRIVENAELGSRSSITVLDPAIGNGALILALLEALGDKAHAKLTVRGFDTNSSALEEAAHLIRTDFPKTRLELTRSSFLDYVLEIGGGYGVQSLFSQGKSEAFDLVIANPPYVRTQVMGTERAQQLSNAFGLTGRVDLYQAFLLGIAHVLAPDGTVGVIVSNRFMTTKGGGTLRAALRQRLDLRQIWDLGDTKIFDAAVLPAVFIARGTGAPSAAAPIFTSIYEVKDDPDEHAADPLAALGHEGVVKIDDGRKFRVRRGVLDRSGAADDIWRLASESGNVWMAMVDRHTWKRFGEIGKIRVGVKTCADKIFIRHDWDTLGAAKPELLRPLTTHHGSGRFRAVPPKKARAILYPHEVVHGTRQAIPLDRFPNSRAYLESHRSALESRSYVTAAGRRWYELWVPQDPRAWDAPKLVFRDISERSTFWIDLDGTVVNGDCYWLTAGFSDNTDLLWLAAAVANSSFAEAFYDHRFNNKLYAGRRRFITQYVEQFPLPAPTLQLSREIIHRAREIYDANHAPESQDMERELDKLVWRAFGLGVEEVIG